MSLSVGIVGLPNVGKSTLFNALLKRQVALAANYPFATVEPNKGIALVPDPRLQRIATVAEDEAGLEQGSIPLKPAAIEFVDIAGLVAGASKGEGLGNKFLANIRECDLICHVLRSFEDTDVVMTGKLDPGEDLDTVRTELILKDLETVQKNQELRTKNQDEKILRDSAFAKLVPALEAGNMANTVPFSDEELTVVVLPLSLLTFKPELFVINVSEDQLTKFSVPKFQSSTVHPEEIVIISAKIEAELADLTETEQKEYLKDLGLDQSGIERLAAVAYTKLNLISFLTVGKIESRAWGIHKGTLAPFAAGVIHTDFAKKFIKAQVIDWRLFVELGGWKKARELGKVRQEGKDYQMQDGDVVEFMIGR